MYSVILTQYDGKILGPIAKVLGFILEWIFILLEKVGMPNIALAIILFTDASYYQTAEVFKTFGQDES